MTETTQSTLADHKYEMTLSLNVLNHLGINLYSSVPAVLSEAVANAWDADATEVDISIDEDKKVISIEDNGHGMNEEQVNERYLHVGYRRRKDENQGDKTPEYGRHVMGRKGIGKLSLFSIAKTVEVYTTDGEDENAFRINIEEIRSQIGEPDEDEEDDPDSENQAGGSYTPAIIEDFPSDLDQGTKIILKDLKKDHIYNTENALKKRLARRFSVIGESHDFHVRVNSDPIHITDRDYFHKLQFLWTLDDGEGYGSDDNTYEDYCEDLDHEPIELNNETESGYEIEGWIGAVEKPKQLEVSYGGETDDLNKIPLLVRGKMAKEDLLDDFNDAGHYTHYLVGEIQADFLDLNDESDIATTSREDMVKTDDRYQELISFLYDTLNEIRSRWDTLRDEQGSQKARETPVIDDWYQRLDKGDKREKARKLFGKINKITTDSEEEKRQLFKFGVLAFERLRYKDNLSRLEDLDPEDLTAVDDLFVDLNEREATLDYQIVKQRIEAIEELDEAIGENYKEKVLQKHLFNNLWLLDPSWEHATESQYKEGSISSEFKDELPDNLTDNEQRGRMDIKYRMATGRHVIVELKRPERKVYTTELMEQGHKYKRALNKCLKDRGRGSENIEIVFVIGPKPKDWEDEQDQETWEESLDKKNMRVLQYRKLLDNAEESYRSYLEKQQQVGEIADIINRIETSDLIS